MCLTMIDPATGWSEMVKLHLVIVEKDTGKLIETSEIFNKTAKQTARQVHQSWFSIYLRSKVIIYDNGSKFKSSFEHLCDSFSVTCKTTTIQNPQSNSILERLH